MTTAVAIPNLDSAQYVRSALHAETSIWQEKNCYIDIWIEVLHALKLDPVAAMPFALGIDFDGDQWTFFKPSHDELRTLYGVEVQELNVWRPLLEHTLEHLPAQRLISTEADAFWLPDTSGTDYQTQHTKTTIVINDLDLENKKLGYFHNAGYHQLKDVDFDRLFRIGLPHDPAFMPLFAELIKTDRVVHRPEKELAQLSYEFLKRHVRERPQQNPIPAFRARLERDLPSLQERGLAYYHAWAFSTIRQLGAAFEFVAANLHWLDKNLGVGLAPASTAFNEIAATSKTMILKGARAVNAKRAFDGAAMFDTLQKAWESGMGHLAAIAG